MQNRVLIVDDENRMRRVLSQLLKDNGFVTGTAEDGAAAMTAIEEFSPDLVLLDLKMPRQDGIETLQQLKANGFAGKVIILTAYGTIPDAVQAIHKGAYDFITKPFDADSLLLAVTRALNQSKLENELHEARIRLDEKFQVEGIITRDPVMKKLLQTVSKIAPTDVSVVITGASGTGKELFANAIHQNSLRKSGSFVALNCGALPESLIESELFGYRKGAFTGAVTSKAGLVEQADGGTLFLDEIGELGHDAQVKLLRFAQSGEFIPLGDTVAHHVDVRLLAATNRNLGEAVESGRFRQDLFYRLNVVSIDLPPLKDRPADLPLLLHHFISRLGKPLGKELFTFSPAAMERLQIYDWPGNVRELENVVYSALVMAEESPIDIPLLPVAIRKGHVLPADSRGDELLPDLVASNTGEIEKKAIIEALHSCKGRKNRTAELLGISRSTLLRKMNKYGLS